MIAGALLYILFEEVVTHQLLQFQHALLGCVIVGLVLFMPSGVLDTLRRRRLFPRSTA